MKVLINKNSYQPNDFSKEKETLMIDGSKYQLIEKEKNHLLIKKDERIYKVFYVFNDKAKSVNLSFKGKTYDMRINDSAKHEADNESGNTITAPMPGKIFKVLKSAGDLVEVGETIVILEAMKMEHALKAKVQGKLDVLNFKEGEQVEADALIAKVLEDNND